MKALKNIIGFSILLSLVVPAGVAFGQSGKGLGLLSLPPLKRELGLSAGGFKLLPHVDIGYGFDSNVFYEDDTNVESPNGSQVLNITPGIGIENVNGQNLELKLRADATVSRYISDNQAVSDQSNVGADVGVGVTFFKASALALNLRERFRRALERRNYETSSNSNRNINEIGAGVIFRPGGGALNVTTNYTFVADLFADRDSDWGDMLHHDISLNGSWKFFPYTALVVDGQWQMRSYQSEGQGAYGELTDSMPLKVRIGLNGFVTKKLSLLLLAGYGNSFHEMHETTAAVNPHENDSFSMLIGEARVSYKLAPTTILQGGYKYDFNDSLFSNYVAAHNIYVDVRQRFAERVDLLASVTFMNRNYSQLPRAYFESAPDAVKAELKGLLTGYDRTDNLLLASLKAKVDITRFLAFSASYNLEVNNGPLNDGGTFGTCISGACYAAPPAYLDYLSHTRHYVLGTFSLRY